jgi:hypothetical protein
VISIESPGPSFVPVIAGARGRGRAHPQRHWLGQLSLRGWRGRLVDEHRGDRARLVGGDAVVGLGVAAVPGVKPFGQVDAVVGVVAAGDVGADRLTVAERVRLHHGGPAGLRGLLGDVAGDLAEPRPAGRLLAAALDYRYGIAAAAIGL